MRTKSISIFNSPSQNSIQDEIIWFPIGVWREVKRIVSTLQRNHTRSVRVGINCSEFTSRHGEIWYEWLMAALEKKFDLELCFDNECGRSSNKAEQRNSFSKIVTYFINTYGDQFNSIELCRNPHDKYIPLTSSTDIHSDELVNAATLAANKGKSITLGGIQGGDFEWLMLLIQSGFLKNVDFIRLDSDGDHWSTSTSFLAETISNVLHENGLSTRVLPTLPDASSESA